MKEENIKRGIRPVKFICGIALNSCKPGEICKIQLPHQINELEFLQHLKNKLQVTDVNTFTINKLIQKRIKYIKNNKSPKKIY